MVGLVDLGDDVGNEVGELADYRVEVELAFVVAEPLPEQAGGVGDVGDVAARAELLDVALQLQALVAVEPEDAGVGGGEVSKEGGVGGVEGKAQLRDGVAPPKEVLPVAADGGEEEAALPHSQHRGHVLDQGSDAGVQAGTGVEAQELLHRRVVDRLAAAHLLRGDRDEEVDGEHRRADRGGKADAALDTGLRLLVERVHADEGAARPGDRRLGGHGYAFGQLGLRDPDRPLQRGVV